MEAEAWPKMGSRLTFLSEGPDTPMPPPNVTQTTYRFPVGTRITFCGTAIGFVIAHEEHQPIHLTVDGIVQPAPSDADNIIKTRANTMNGSEVLRFGVRD